MYLRKRDIDGAQFVKAYIEQHFAAPFDIEDLARLVGFSKSHLHKVYKQYYKISPIEYKISLRMQHGAELLQADLSVKEVATAVGYASIKSKFSLLFKKHFGVTPMTYKKQYRHDLDGPGLQFQ